MRNLLALLVCVSTFCTLSRADEGPAEESHDLVEVAAVEPVDDVFAEKRARNPYSWMNFEEKDKRARNPYSWMNKEEENKKTKRARNPYSWMNSVPQEEKRARNPYSWMNLKGVKRSLQAYYDDSLSYYRAPRNPYSWQYMASPVMKRAGAVRNPYSWMAQDK